VHPELDDDKLSQFNARKTPIISLIKTPEDTFLKDTSKPVRDLINMTYGVSYNE